MLFSLDLELSLEEEKVLDSVLSMTINPPWKKLNQNTVSFVYVFFARPRTFFYNFYFFEALSRQGFFHPCLFCFFPFSFVLSFGFSLVSFLLLFCGCLLFSFFFCKFLSLWCFLIYCRLEFSKLKKEAENKRKKERTDKRNLKEQRKRVLLPRNKKYKSKTNKQNRGFQILSSCHSILCAIKKTKKRFIFSLFIFFLLFFFRLSFSLINFPTISLIVSGSL